MTRENIRGKTHINQHSDQQCHLLTVETLLAQQEAQLISKRLYIFMGKILKKENNGNNDKLQLEEFFSWNTSFYNHSIIFSLAEPEKILSPI